MTARYVATGAIMKTSHGDQCVGEYLSLDPPCRKFSEIGAGNQS